jgi:SH3-like domain-containing protein
VRNRALIGIGLALSLAFAASPGNAADDGVKKPARTVGSKTGLALPRYVSLKSDKVNVRRGPNTDQPVVWVFSRAGLPVEIFAESENWRRVRDSEGAEGWVFHSLLSGRRTVLVSPWAKGQESVRLHDSRSTGSHIVAELQSGVIGDVVECDGEWCELTIDEYSGYVEQGKLWGVYRDEEVE